MTSSISDTLATIATTGIPFVLEDWQSTVLWMLVTGFIIAFILAFAVGANDVANSFGTTVGAGTLSLKQACILASLFETLGAILLGAKVGTTIRKGIVDVEIYEGDELMAGEISAMLASGLWQLIATFLKLPVSGTHSIVGATVGFSLVAHGTKGVNWVKMGLIVGSWFLSPVLAGAMAAGFYFVLRRFILQKDDPVSPGLLALPIMYGFTIAINCFSVFYSGAPLLGFDKLEPWVDVVISFAIGLIVAFLVQFVVVRKLRTSFWKSQDEKVSSQMILPSNFGKKATKLPTVMETIAEKESPEGSNTKLEVNGSGDAGRLNGESVEQLHNDNVAQHKSLQTLVHADGNPHKRVRIESVKENIISPRTVEEAKMLREQNSKRSKSVGGHYPSVRIPPLLQLEQKVLKASVPHATVKDIRDEIRRNFSEPSMINLTRRSDADVYEVFINRQRKLITIQRKSSESNDRIQHLQHNDNKPPGSDHELDNLVSSIPTDLKLEEPFEDSDEEGLAMTVPQVTDPLVSDMYSGAIEEGFRRLSTSQQNIIAIKIDDNDDGHIQHDKLTKDEIMEAKEGRTEVRKMFSFLQILTACFGSFAHGGNDVSNAIGPLIAVWIIYNEGAVEQKSSTPLWILLYGGIGICCGLWVWGRRVIKTMGKDLTNLTPSRGFAIELMSAITVLTASNVGLPVSTTHCKVGAVVAVGWVRAREAVDWKIFRNIVLAWFVTVPISGGLSAVIFAIIQAAVGFKS